MRSLVEEEVEKKADSAINNESNELLKSDDNRLVVYSPCTGKVIPITQVNDEVFNKEIVGKGIAILPEITSIYSPVNGIVKYIPSSKHAVIITSDDGLDVLVHIGLDTVGLNGKYFDVMVDVETRVEVGDLLLQFDMKSIIDLGYDVVIPVVITNSDQFNQVLPTNKKKVFVKDCLIDVQK